jgi:hypothetical protein
MQRFHTTKLFFGKYPYKILLARSDHVDDQQRYTGWTVHNACVFLADNNIEHRMYNQVRHGGKHKKRITINSSLFLRKKDDFEKCINLWRDWIQSVTSPFKDEHVSLLQDRTELIVRKTLLYKKYQYVVAFKREYKDDMSELSEWINDNLKISPKESATAKWYEYGWNPRLYLADENDLVLVKLTHGDRIRSITVVCTFDQLEQQSNQP